MLAAVSVRNPYLDAIRATAIVLVVLHHLAGVCEMPRWLSLLALRGYIGVDLFFVLSGWLIGGQLFRAEQRTGTIDLTRFWVRRWARTLPAYYAVLLGAWGLGFIGGHDWPGGVPIPTVSSIFFTQNYTSPWTFPISWSLCVEEHFYLVLPLVLLAVRRRRLLAIASILLLLAASPMLRWLSFDPNSAATRDEFFASTYFRTHLRLEGLVLGMLVAAAKEYRTRTWNWCARHTRALAWTGLFVLLASSYNPWAFAWTDDDMASWFCAVPSFFGVSLGVAMMLPAAVVPRANGQRWWAAPVTWIAEHAYVLYLLHMTAFAAALQLCISARISAEWVAVVLMLAATVGAAWLLRAVVEKPGLALRDRWENRRAASTETALA
jgi:peptidoglycan/LPS O-acetylase OafA/YrhL